MQVVQRVQIRYRSLEEKLVGGSSVDEQVVELTEDCGVGADDVTGASASVGSDGTLEALVRMASVLAVCACTLFCTVHAEF